MDVIDRHLQFMKQAQTGDLDRESPSLSLKHELLRILMSERPETYLVNKRDGTAAVTHVPTGLKLTVPSKALPKSLSSEEGPEITNAADRIADVKQLHKFLRRTMISPDWIGRPIHTWPWPGEDRQSRDYFNWMPGKPNLETMLQKLRDAKRR